MLHFSTAQSQIQSWPPTPAEAVAVDSFNKFSKLSESSSSSSSSIVVVVSRSAVQPPTFPIKLRTLLLADFKAWVMGKDGFDMMAVNSLLKGLMRSEQTE